MFGIGKKKNIKRIKDEIVKLEGKLAKELNVDEEKIKNMIQYLEKIKKGENVDKNKTDYQGQLKNFIHELKRTKQIEDEIEKHINDLEHLGHPVGGTPDAGSWAVTQKEVRGHLVRGRESTVIAHIRRSLPQIRDVVYGSEIDPTLELLKDILEQLDKLKNYEKKRTGTLEKHMRRIVIKFR